MSTNISKNFFISLLIIFSIIFALYLISVYIIPHDFISTYGIFLSIPITAISAGILIYYIQKGNEQNTESVRIPKILRSHSHLYSNSETDIDLARELDIVCHQCGIKNKNDIIIYKFEPNGVLSPAFAVNKTNEKSIYIDEMLVKKLDKDQLDALICHELAHIVDGNYFEKNIGMLAKILVFSVLFGLLSLALLLVTSTKITALYFIPFILIIIIPLLAIFYILKFNEMDQINADKWAISHIGQGNIEHYISMLNEIKSYANSGIYNIKRANRTSRDMDRRILKLSKEYERRSLR